MKIHSSAKFTGKIENYHNDFDIQLTDKQIIENSAKITNLAIGKFKQKCEKNFEVDFGEMYFFEVYFYDQEKEIEIFKREKEP